MENNLTTMNLHPTIMLAGETDAGSAEVHPVRAGKAGVKIPPMGDQPKATNGRGRWQLYT